jgi:hypothetical protein
MMMEYLFLVILNFASIGAIEVSAAIAFYCIILGFCPTHYTGSTHIHVNNYVKPP